MTLNIIWVTLPMAGVGYALILSGVTHQHEFVRIGGALMIYGAGKLSAGWRLFR